MCAVNKALLLALKVKGADMAFWDKDLNVAHTVLCTEKIY